MRKKEKAMGVFDDIKTGLEQAIEYEEENSVKVKFIPSE